MAEKYIIRKIRHGTVNLECSGHVFHFISSKEASFNELPFKKFDTILKDNKLQKVRPICCNVMDENQSVLEIMIPADAEVEFIDEAT